MNEPNESYLSRPVRVARAVSIVASWVIWVSVLLIGFMHVIPQGVVILLFAAGLAPYLASLHIVEPWLMRREERKHQNRRAEERGDG